MSVANLEYMRRQEPTAHVVLRRKIMKSYPVDKIRNVALLGHGGCGKTTLIESILFALGETKRLGRVEDGTTVSDYDKEEIARKFSIGAAVIPVEYDDHKYNLIDAPGYFDFQGEVNSALRVAGGAVIVLDAASGIEVGTEKAWQACEALNLPRIIFLNKMEKDNIEFAKLIDQLKEKFGKKIAPFEIPMYKDEHLNGYINVVDHKARCFSPKGVTDCEVPSEYEDQLAPFFDLLSEAVAETDEALMEKYFEGEPFTVQEIHDGLRKGVVKGDIVPVLVGSAVQGLGIRGLLNMAFEYLPTPQEINDGAYHGEHPDTKAEEIRTVDDGQPFSAAVFKTIVDPFVGKISLFKVYSGSIRKDMEVLNSSKDETERITNIFLLRGKKQVEVDHVGAGDIGAVAKLQYTETGDTLCDKTKPIVYHRIEYPEPNLYLAVEPKDKKDEDKIGTSLQRLMEEDPTLHVYRNKETHQMLVGGLGTMHIQVTTAKLKNVFGVEVELVPQKIAYRETIKGNADVQGKHKKQSGGSGQYGDVHIRFSPSKQEFEFEEDIFGGSVPKQYIPAVEKGLRESIVRGVLAGYPVVNVKAVLYDGSYHDVDSNENAFKMAASIAFKKGMEVAKPVLLEPVMHLEITIPDDYMGDIMGDMNKRRGRILGMEQASGGYQKVVAEAPQAELFSYATDLRSMTQARGSFAMAFDRYEEVPAHLAQKIIDEAKRDKED